MSSSKYSYIYSKPRRKFGKQTLFQDVKGHIMYSIMPNIAEQRLYMLRNPVHCGVQATPILTEHDVKAKKLKFEDKAINHEEGGWPKDVNYTNEEHVARHVRKNVHDEHYIKAVLNVAPTINHFMDQNNAINMYESYFRNMPPEARPETYKQRVWNVLRDPFYRPISCIAWTIEDNPKLAVSYCSKDYAMFNDQADEDNTICYLWDINKTTEPLSELEPFGPCWQIACSPTDPEVFIAGLEKGLVNLFDTRVGKRFVSCSDLYESHKEPITALLYSASRTNSEFFTGSLDGYCCWWDVRKFDVPIDRLAVHVNVKSTETPDANKVHGVSVLEFDRNVPTKFLCGTETGYIINVNRAGRTLSEVLSCCWKAHDGPVRSAQRSPCTTRMFISCGDWNVRVWSEETRSAPISTFVPYPSEVTGVTWSPLRYSSFMTISSDGKYYYWDLLKNYSRPLEVLNLSPHSLTNIKVHQQGETVAVSDTNGAVYLVLFPEHMVYAGQKDRNNMQLLYQRETNREHILDNRNKEIRLKQRVEEAAEAEPVEVVPDEEEQLKQVEEHFWEMVNKETENFAVD